MKHGAELLLELLEVELVFVAKEQLSMAWKLASDSKAEVRRFGLQEHDAIAIRRSVGDIGLDLLNLGALGVRSLIQVCRSDLGEFAEIVVFNGLY